MLEHVEEPWAFVAYCSNLVKNDGDLIFTTINRTIQSRILAIELAERIAGLLPRGTHDWEKFVTVEELIMDLREVKFRIEDIKGKKIGIRRAKRSFESRIEIRDIRTGSFASRF